MNDWSVPDRFLLDGERIPWTEYERIVWLRETVTAGRTRLHRLRNAPSPDSGLIEREETAFAEFEKELERLEARFFRTRF